VSSNKEDGVILIRRTKMRKAST